MKKVVAGIIGAGRIGRIHAGNLAALPNVVLKTISDIQAEHVKPWASGLGAGVSDDSADIMADDEMNAVLICSSTDTHTDFITKAARAGKHIFCEKPISMDLGLTRKALGEVERAGVLFQTGFNRRFDANFMKMRDSVRSGGIGDPHVIKITSRDPSPPPYDYIGRSGGLFMDMAIHDFDMARYLSGSEVVEVYAQGGALVDPEIGKLGDIDTATIMLRFASGAFGVIDNSRKAVYGYDQRAEVFGSKGTVAAQNEFPTTVEWSTAEGVYREKPLHFFLERYKESYMREIEAFVDCVLTGKKPLVDGNDGMQAELLARSALQSLRENRPVRPADVLEAALKEEF